MLPGDFCFVSGFSASGFLAMARVKGWAAAAIVQADITSIQCSVRDTEADTVTYNQALTVSSVVYNALQTGAIWPDATGYNFLFTVPASAFPTPSSDPFDRVYVVSFLFTPVSGEPFVVDFKYEAKRRN